ncbi:MAG: hypothetical protein GPJ21_15505 [Microcystis aeruginosa W13-11]|nr:hypothetical protein [Microcystis aeruginosa W13-11]
MLHFLEAFSEIILYSIELRLEPDGDKILVFLIAILCFRGKAIASCQI